MNQLKLSLQRSPALALLLLAPVLGELVSGHQTLFQFINRWPLSCRRCLVVLALSSAAN